MEISVKKFLEREDIYSIVIFYYIKDNGKKNALEDHNNYTIDEIEEYNENYPKGKKEKWQLSKLSESELSKIKKVRSVYLKHHPNMYCIDIDDENITCLDELLEVMESEGISDEIIDIFSNSCWCPGNTKGIHIYIKISNVPNYSKDTDILTFITGDFIKKSKNMWEDPKKIMYNYNPESEVIDFNKIKSIFKSDQLNPKPKTEKSSETKKLSESKINNNTNEELLIYIGLCIENNIFSKISGYDKWLRIGFLINSLIGEEGFDVFHTISKQMPGYEGKGDCYIFYTRIDHHCKRELKKNEKITLGTLKYYVKEADINIYSKINNEMKLLYKETQKYDFPIDKINNFDSDYFHTLSSYSEKKQYFEIFCCKVLRPQPVYIYSENDAFSSNGFNCLLYSEKQIISAFKHLKSSIYKKKKTEDCSEEEKNFINIWLEDVDMKLYNKMDFMPFNGCRDLINIEKGSIYNLFNGYNPAIKTFYDKSKKEDILKPFKDLVFEICGADTKVYNYFYKWIAHIIQKPRERIPISFIIKSKQGVGKNLILDTIGNIIGQEHYISSSNPNDFFGEYAEGFYRKLLVNLNECQASQTFDYEGKIKSFITEQYITLNAKHLRQTQVENCSRLIFTTNKPNPLPIDIRSKDRRFVVVESTEKYLGKEFNTYFWTQARERFKNPKFLACLYDDLNSLDIENTNWLEERPITSAYIEMCKQFVPSEALFLENYIENNLCNDICKQLSIKNSNIDIPTSEIFNSYNSFCETNKYNNEKISITKFHTRINELDLGITKVKTSSTTVYRFNPYIVYKNMVSKNWIVSRPDYSFDDDDDNNEYSDNKFKDYFVEL